MFTSNVVISLTDIFFEFFSHSRSFSIEAQRKLSGQLNKNKTSIINLDLYSKSQHTNPLILKLFFILSKFIFKKKTVYFNDALFPTFTKKKLAQFLVSFETSNTMVAQVNLSFDNLCYQVEKTHFTTKRETKKILKEISGEFLSNELSAIIGVSGGGKSSLLDILSGFRYKNMTGSIKINESKISTRFVREVSSYVMQENMLHDYLTVIETMMFAEKFKRKKDHERESSEKILESLNICEKKETFVMNLSGGEKKRLSIAIELVDDPSIIFLDEPTTGLDSTSSMQCLKILKNLANEGRTIICTIHSPSAAMFAIFDHIYALNEGKCIYQGSVKSLVPFLNDLDLVCPENYNPADFLLEISTHDYGPQNDRLIEKIQNGRNFEFRLTRHKNQCIIQTSLEKPSRSNYLLPFFEQVQQILHRNFLISKRNKTLVVLRLTIHLVMGLIFGFIYKDTGQEASRFFDNYRYIMVTVIFQLYMSYFSLQTTSELFAFK